MFALSGTHRSGKTTLAKAVAAKLDIPFVEMNVAQVFTDLGISPKSHMDFKDRLFVQGKILRHMEIKLGLAASSVHNGVYITDRSPYDVLGYTMADVQRDTLDDALRHKMAAQIQLARHITASNLLGIITVPSFPNPPEDPKSAQACPFYMDHVAICIQSCLHSYPTTQLMAMIIESVSLDERVAELVEVLQPIVEGVNRSKLWTPGQK